MDQQAVSTNAQDSSVFWDILPKLWVIVWIVFSIWIASKLLRGRKKLQNNFATVQQELHRMQQHLESRQQTLNVSPSEEEDCKKKKTEADKDK